MSSRKYAISSSGITITGASTLIFLNPGVSASLEILRMWIGQSYGATSAQQRVQVVTQVAAFPTLTSFTPRKFSQGDPASVIVGGTGGAAGTCGINASSEGAGSKTTLLEDCFNVLNGWHFLSTPDDRIVLPASSGSGLGIYFPQAPGMLTNWAFGMIYREMG